MTTLLLTALGILLAAVGFELGDKWPYNLGSLIGWAATMAAIYGAYRQYAESKPLEYHFAEDSWQSAENEFTLHIPKSLHKRGTGTTVTVLMCNASGFEEVICDIQRTKSGGVVIRATKPFTGKLVIS